MHLWFKELLTEKLLMLQILYEQLFLCELVLLTYPIWASSWQWSTQLSWKETNCWSNIRATYKRRKVTAYQSTEWKLCISFITRSMSITIARRICSIVGSTCPSHLMQHHRCTSKCMVSLILSNTYSNDKFSNSCNKWTKSSDLKYQSGKK